MEADVPLYRDIFAHADAGLALLSAQGDWLEVNPAMARMLRSEAATLQGVRAHARLCDEDTTRRIDAWCAAQAPDSQTLECASPSAAWRFRLTRLSDAAPATALLQLEDLSGAHARQRQDEAMARLHDQLAYGISHDLRAPLRSIAGFAAKLDEDGAVHDERARADLARIRAAAARADRLAGGLLELLRALRQPMREAEVDLSLLAEWVLSDLRDAQPERAATLEVAPGLIAWGDEHWLRVMLHKLLDNAWKFSAEGPQVEIRVGGEIDHGRVRLRVQDHGSGFDMRYAHKLFIPFQRLHGAEQGGGDGLGLAIAQQVVTRHGGDIRAESVPGEGSTFHIELPAAAGGPSSEAS